MNIWGGGELWHVASCAGHFSVSAWSLPSMISSRLVSAQAVHTSPTPVVQLPPDDAFLPRDLRCARVGCRGTSKASAAGVESVE